MLFVRTDSRLHHVARRVGVERATAGRGLETRRRIRGVLYRTCIHAYRVKG